MMHMPIFTVWSSPGGHEPFQFSKQLLSPSSLANIAPVVREAMETGSNLQDHSLEEDRDSRENLTFFAPLFHPTFFLGPSRALDTTRKD